MYAKYFQLESEKDINWFSVLILACIERTYREIWCILIIVRHMKFVDTLGKILHVKFLGYAHWFMSIIISHMKDHSISVDQDIYSTSIVAKYLDTATAKTSKKFYKTILPSDIIFTKYDTSTSDETFEKLNR